MIATTASCGLHRLLTRGWPAPHIHVLGWWEKVHARRRRGAIGASGDGDEGSRVGTPGGWRRRSSRVVAATACSGSSKASTSTTTAHVSKPNVLFILTDDLDLGEIAQMPNLQSMLVDQGVSFSNYFVSRVVVLPVALDDLRGQYSHNTGVETNGGVNGGFETAHRLGVENSTIGTWLQADGYRTALIGKYLNGYPEHRRRDLRSAGLGRVRQRGGRATRTRSTTTR